MKTYKRFLAFALTLIMALALIPATALAESDVIQILVDGSPVNTDVAPFIDDNGRTMVPVRFIGEALNADVVWENSSRTVIITRGATEITMQIGSRELSVNGNITLMDTAAIIRDDRTFVPVRFIAVALNMTVSWDAATRTVSLSSDVHPFSTIFEYNGTVYSLYASPEITNFFGLEGSPKFTPLPESIAAYLESEGEYLYVYRFAIYRDKIYYLAAEAGNDITYGSIYECNLDGSGNEKVVSVIESFSDCMIVGGFLYYEAKTPMGEHYINALDLSGAVMQQAYDDFPVYIEPGIVTYNGFYYYFSDYTLYKEDIQTEHESIITTLTPDSMNAYSGGSVIAVVCDTVYYVSVGIKDASAGVYLFSISINGGTIELLGSWYVA